jgi:hypothetical protein
MKFAQTVVSESGFRDVTHTPRRLAALSELLRHLADDGVELAALPDCYLTVLREADVIEAAAEVAGMAERTGLNVGGGVDANGRSGKASSEADELVRAGRLPFFGFAASPNSVSAGVSLWRQASITNADADLAPDDRLPGRDRLVPGLGASVAILLCGELFNRRARDGVAAAEPRLVIDLAHARMGQGLIPAMKNLAGLAGCLVAHSQHLAGWSGRSLHFVTAEGNQKSVPTDSSPFLGDDEFWIGRCVRTV